MKQLTEHFNESEFVCPCCGNLKYDNNMVDLMERIYKYADNTANGCSAIYITSGYRCPKESVAVGGYANDAHTRGLAADFIIYDKYGKAYAAEEMAAIAHFCGASGVGIMTGACHADVRTLDNYVNGAWFGDERNGADITGDEKSINAFVAKWLPKTKTTTTNKHKLTVAIDGKTVYESEV